MVNTDFLKSCGLELFIKDFLLDELKSCGWTTECLNSIFEPVKPTPMGEIVQGYVIDRFPIADSCSAFCILKMQ